MVIEYIRYELPVDAAAGFEAAYESARTSLDESEHCLAYELSRCVEAPGSYILRIDWDSLDGHEQGFRSSPQFRPFLAAVSPYIGQVAEMRHYRVTTVRGEAASRSAA